MDKPGNKKLKEKPGIGGNPDTPLETPADQEVEENTGDRPSGLSGL